MIFYFVKFVAETLIPVDYSGIPDTWTENYRSFFHTQNAVNVSLI